MMHTLSLADSNTFLIKLLQKGKPFFISRIGIGPETTLSCLYKQLGTLNARYLPLIRRLDNNAGIYTKDGLNMQNIVDFCKRYMAAVENSTALAAFRTAMVKEQEFLRNKQRPVLYSRILEPFYCSLEDIKPWSHCLLGKKVLIVNPFTDSMKKQLENGFQIFKDPEKKLFMDGQKFIFYKTFITSAGNHIHSSWLDTFDIMCEDIRKLDFDVALLGCGGYGLPLCNYIYKDLNKSAIYVGGGLQLLFGIMGKRWENNAMWKKIIRANNTKFIRPSGDEVIKDKDRIEGGCYW